MSNHQPRPWTAASLLLASSCLLVGNVAAATNTAAERNATQPKQLSDRANAAFGLHRSEIVHTVISPTDAGGAFAFVPNDAGPFVIELNEHSVRSDAYQVLVQGADGSLRPAESTAVRTMRGEVLNISGATVAGTMMDDGLHARVTLPDESEYWIEPIAGRVADAGNDQYVVYRTEDVKDTNATCAAGEHLRIGHAFGGGEHGGGGHGGEGASTGTISVAELACDADVEYYQDWGSVNNVQDRINSVINTVNQQYESEVGITHEISTIIVRTAEPDPYSSTDAETLLNQFRNHWNANHGNISRDAAQLFTGKELNSSTIGIAWLNAVCTSYAYNVVQSDFNGNFSCATDLSAHELGHNWGAGHCNCSSYTMNPSITCANQFHPNLTIPTIVNYRDGVDCLDSGGGGDPTGACCIDGDCSIQTESDCLNAGGEYQGDGTDCQGDPCFVPTGACCVGETCSVETEPDCNDAGGAYLGDGTDCSASPCNIDGDVINLATSDYETNAGSIQSGSYFDTHTQNDVHEQLREEHTGGPPPQRVSMLSHTWTFDVAPGELYSFKLDAYREANDHDSFAFSYSLDNSNYTQMLVVTKTSDDDTLQTFQFPEDIQGQVYIRVEDTDRTPGNGRTHSVYVDEMFIVSWESNGGDPTGACCLGSDCQITTESDCANLGGTYHGDGTSCSPSLCGGAESMFVSNLNASVYNAGGGEKHGAVQVSMVDDFGNPVSNATVTGSFTGAFTETQSAATNANGVAELMTDAAGKGNPGFEFCVDNVTHADLVYDEQANVETCESN